MIKRLIQEHRSTFLRYALVGVSGTLLDIGLFALLITATPLGDTLAGRVIATTISFIVAVINNYTWNRRWTFKDRSSGIRKQFAKFLTVSSGGWFLNTAFFMAFSWFVPPVIAKVGASVAVLTYNYIANRFWTFKAAAQLESE